MYNLAKLMTHIWPDVHKLLPSYSTLHLKYLGKYLFDRSVIQTEELLRWMIFSCDRQNKKSKILIQLQ